jgi:hypothetical protein
VKQQLSPLPSPSETVVFSSDDVVSAALLDPAIGKKQLVLDLVILRFA